MCWGVTHVENGSSWSRAGEDPRRSGHPGTCRRRCRCWWPRIGTSPPGNRHSPRTLEQAHLETPSHPSPPLAVPDTVSYLFLSIYLVLPPHSPFQTRSGISQTFGKKPLGHDPHRPSPSPDTYVSLFSLKEPRPPEGGRSRRPAITRRGSEDRGRDGKTTG